jgi:hypothetical protein
VSLREILFVGGVELRWPLSKVRRGHRLDDFFKSHTRFAPFDQTPGVPVTRQARGPTGTVSPEVPVACHLLLLLHTVDVLSLYGQL